MSLKNFLKWIEPYSLEIVVVVTAAILFSGLVVAVEHQHCADDIPFTDFQTVQFCIYLTLLLLGVITMTNAARSRTTANEIKEMMQTKKEPLE